MAKKVVSVALHAKRKNNDPIKIIGKTKKLEKVLKNVFNYMKSDAYMFAPLLSPRSFNPTAFPDSSGGQICFDKKMNKKLGEYVKEYLKSDCYMYAPLASACSSLLKGPELGEKVDTISVVNEKEPRVVEELNREGMMNMCREVENEEISNPTNRVVVKHSLLHRETMKRMAPQNRRASGTGRRRASDGRDGVKFMEKRNKTRVGHLVE